jgi:hypothetical protein
MTDIQEILDAAQRLGRVTRDVLPTDEADRALLSNPKVAIRLVQMLGRNQRLAQQGLGPIETREAPEHPAIPSIHATLDECGVPRLDSRLVPMTPQERIEWLHQYQTRLRSLKLRQLTAALAMSHKALDELDVPKSAYTEPGKNLRSRIRLGMARVPSPSAVVHQALDKIGVPQCDSRGQVLDAGRRIAAIGRELAELRSGTATRAAGAEVHEYLTRLGVPERAGLSVEDRVAALLTDHGAIAMIHEALTQCGAPEGQLVHQRIRAWAYQFEKATLLLHTMEPVLVALRRWRTEKARAAAGEPHDVAGAAAELRSLLLHGQMVARLTDIA